MSILKSLKVWAERSKKTLSATDEILSLLKDAGLHTIPFVIEFLDDDEIAITLIREKDDPHRRGISPDDEVNVKVIASIFANTAAKRGLSFKPGVTLDFGFQHDH